MTPTAVGGGFGTETGGGVGPAPAGTETGGGIIPTAPPAATEVLTNPTAVGVTPVGTTMGTNIPATGESDINRLKTLLDFSVIDSQNNDLGKVNDMILDTAGGMIRFVSVSSGGFLGIGQRNILIPWNMLKVGTDNNNNNVFVFSGNSDALKNAPQVDDLAKIDFTNSGWDMDFNAYWNNPGAMTGTTVAGTPVVGTPVATSAAGGNLQPTAGAASGTVNRGAAVDFVLASKLVKADVVDTSVFNGGAAGTSVPGVVTTPMGAATPDAYGNSGVTSGTSVAGGSDVNNMTNLGQVVDAVVDPQAGSITYLVVAADASLNLGDKWIPVPLSQAQFVSKGDNDNNFVVLVPADRLSKAPNFDVNALPNTSTAGWDADLTSYWGVSR